MIGTQTPPRTTTYTLMLYSYIGIMLFLLQGCSIKLIADYDEQTDQAVTQLQRKFETFFVKLERQVGTNAAKYEKHIDFYNEIKVDISALKLRVGAIPNNDYTIKQVDLLAQNVDLLEAFHKEGIADIEVVAIPRQDFNIALSNILKLELAKKLGQ